MTMTMDLIRHIAGLYSGKAIKGDFTQVYITGNEIWMAQQILASQHTEQAEGAQGERIVQTAPERIYLIVGAECPRDIDFSELTEVSWCENDIDDGIEYVRADKAAALAQPSPKFCACAKCDDAYSCSTDGCQFKPVQAQPSPAPELPERGTQHRFSTTEQTCRHDFAGVWWNDKGVTKTGRECRHCGFFIADMAEAPELERPEVAGWRDRILKAHPGSDPRYWPDALLVQHMTAEIADLRAAQARPSVDLEHIGSLISVFRNATRADAENGGREYFEKARSAEQELRQEIDRIVGALRADAERWKEQFACMQLQRDHHRDRADAAQARVAELEQSQGAEVFLTLTSEITQLKAKLAELEKQKEFGHVFVSIKEGHKCFEFDEYSHAYSFPVGEHQLYAAPVAQAGQVQVPEGSAEFSQFLSAVMDAAGLVRHGRRSKELSEYLGAQCMKYRRAAAPAQGGGHA